MRLDHAGKTYLPVSGSFAAYIDELVKKAAYEAAYGKPMDYRFEPDDIAGWKYGSNNHGQ